MAHNPQGQAPDPNYDPAGNTQMFRAFVDEGGVPQAGPRAAQPQSGGNSRVGLIVGVLVAVVVVAAAAWFALG
ncbi:hypothetical protein SRB5_39520 [Streptomyces sp. RB5]|uniref:Uncharacterized protein n=1 Tax=Streptomyces smaragdinus TaxID=2585196 RepID=A0A7K0CJY9_9ACTN|nr:hypothetical protein [Streptomyces smaragdinus]MQY13797.1 hypothetical protein [Streptomyces smaragdinus]